LTPIYKVVFRPRAAKSFKKLDVADQRQIARKLIERSANPNVPGDRVREIPNAYKIKLRSSGIRLIYQMRESELVILVLAIGKREREEAYKDAIREFGKHDT
jgi:mRNA interferase RelE/StbE